MRILFLTSSFPPVVGGGETYAYTVTHGLAGLGHDVHVVTDWPANSRAPKGTVRDRSILVSRLTAYRDDLFAEDKLPWEQMLFSLHGDIDRAVESFRPDIVFTNSLDSALHGRIVANQYGIAWAAAFHEHAPENEPLGQGRMQTVYGLLKPDVVFAGSEFYAARARRFLPGSQVELIYHGVGLLSPVAMSGGAEVRLKYGVRPDDVLVTCAGRLKSRKGILELIHAVAEARRTDPRIRLVVAGTVSSASREYANSLYSAIGDLGLGNVATVDEELDVTGMPSLLAASDVVALPSHEEGLGLAALEAMAAGRPTILTDVVGFREILKDREIARVIPPHDVSALTLAINELAADEPLRASLGARGLEHVKQHFDVDQMLRRTEKCLVAAISNQKRNS